MGFARKSYYEILDIDPSATSEEIKRAYRMVRGTFGPESIATYSLYSPAESELIARKLEEAYQILTDTSRRSRYDAYRRFMERQGDAPLSDPRALFEETLRDSDAGDPARITEVLTQATVEAAPAGAEGRAPSLPPEAEREWDEVVGAAPLGAAGTLPSPRPAATQARVGAKASGSAPTAAPTPKTISPSAAPNQPERKVWARGRIPESGTGWRRPSAPPVLKPPEPLQEASVSPEEVAALEAEHGIGGAFFQALRERKGIPLSEIARRTKIGTLYLENIEAEAFGDLPPAVYLRGFVMHYARLLRLDEARIVPAYMARFEAATGAGGPL